MKKKLLSFAALISLGLSTASVTATQANAASVDITNDMPKSGSIVLNDNNSIAKASNPLFTESSKQSQNTTSTPWFAISFARQAENIKNGRWVAYTDHNNYLNGYKWSHSNFLYYNGIHSSSAKVGKNKTVQSGFKTANKWSYATAKGKGAAKAWYNIF